ncbi:hypothetical protein [Maricaulis parjimensis]|uniref:hypothetical protein n=1 Tax=Maricaulis parjimensis TaxID=144023 RepID=UPI0019393E76|nr:hypothetical protein [Maricaulis parjimensis]
MTAITTQTAGRIRKIAQRRVRRQDEFTADYLALVVKPGMRTVQIGGSDLGSVCLKRGARHEIIAPIAAIEALQSDCDRRQIPTNALRGGPALRKDEDATPIDLAIIGPEVGFPVMAGNWRHVAAAMRQDGLLILVGADHGSSARLADALMMDPAWVLQERACGDAAVFRKARAVQPGRTMESLTAASRPGRRPRGVRQGPIASLINRFFPGKPEDRLRTAN